MQRKTLIKYCFEPVRTIMNKYETIYDSFKKYIQLTFAIDITNIKGTFTLNVDEKKQQFGDINSNIALVASKKTNTNPLDIAKKIVLEFQCTDVKKITIDGPGFINFYCQTSFFSQLAKDIFTHKKDFFKSNTFPTQKINIEFVSANPTGPLHFGHGRGGIIGDVLSNILLFQGHSVTKEFYINDAGNQIQKLGKSLKIRCLQNLGENIPFPEDGYHGAYITTLAKKIISEKGSIVTQKEDSFFSTYAKNALLKNIKKTLADYGIIFDVYFSEKTLHEDDSVTKVLTTLKRKNLLYEKDNAWWFKATQFGDDKDRVVMRSSGEVTYIAADIAYLQNKIARGNNKLIMILGHDHHSYVTRLHAIQKALKLEKTPLDIILYQLVKVTKQGALVRMSKRAGTMTTLQDIISTVGTDVARFFYLHRKAEAQLEFDLALALKQTDENPVYYIQYAYVRTGSILQKACEFTNLQSSTENDVLHIGKEEQLLLKKIISLKELLVTIARQYHTHALTYFVLELATLFHNYYAHNQVIDTHNPEKSRARLLIVTITRETLSICLDLLGISKPKKM